MWAPGIKDRVEGSSRKDVHLARSPSFLKDGVVGGHRLLMQADPCPISYLCPDTMLTYRRLVGVFPSSGRSGRSRHTPNFLLGVMDSLGVLNDGRGFRARWPRDLTRARQCGRQSGTRGEIKSRCPHLLCVTLGKLPQPSKTQFPHLESGESVINDVRI